MITNSFHKNRDLIGVNIERKSDESFIVSIAYKVKNKWQAKTLSGISGDFDNKILFDQVFKKGITLDITIASSMFSNCSWEFVDYETN